MNPNDYPDELFEYYSIPAYQDGGQPSIESGSKINSVKLLLQTGTILFGKLNPRVEKVWIVKDYTSHRKIGSTEWLPIVPVSDVDSAFVYFLQWSEHVMTLAKQRVSGSTPSRQRVDPSSFYEIQVPIPLREEQLKIAALLAAVQRSIEQQERLIALTTELKKALLHKLFTEGTRGEPQRQTEIGPVPESWDIVPFKSTGEVVYGIQAAVANNTKPIGTKIITNKNITLDGEFNLEKQSYFEIKTARHRETILKKGDILFNWRSGSKEHVGKTAFFDLDGEWTHSSFILRIRAATQINNRFLFHYLSWLRATQYFVKLHNYMVNAKFNKSAVTALPTVIPERSEQDEIASTLDTAIQKVNHHRMTHTLLNELFRTLLHQLMTAQIRVNDLDLPELNIEETTELSV